MKQRFQILALDGGGIKGLFSAAVLAHLERDLGTSVADHFDLITGTSTGAIIALGLGLGVRPRDIVAFYVARGRDIFPNLAFPRLRQAFRSKFCAVPLERALKDCFGEKTLLGDSKKRLVIPSYNLGEDAVYLFKTPHHLRLRRDWRVPAWQVARASSAAPTFFPVFNGPDRVRLVDGGVWANNPTLVGITEAVGILGVPASAIQVLNLGTTDPVKTYSDRLDRGGFLRWALPAASLIMAAQSAGAYAQAQHLIGKDSILRVDPKVPDGLFALDKLSEDKLLAKAAHESRIYSDDFKRMFVGHVAPKFTPLYPSKKGQTE